MATLIIESNQQKIQLDQPLTIGSGEKSMIQIQDPGLAPIHCQIIRTAQGFKAIALDQKTGIAVNGVRVREGVLKNGDRIMVGSTRFIFQGDGNAARQGTQRIAGAQQQGRQPGTQRIAGAPGRPPTGRIAGAPAQRPGTQRVAQPQQGRPGTQRVPQAQPPRPGTQRVPQQQPPRPGTQRVQQPGTQRVQRPGTQRVPPAQACPGTQRVQQPGTQRVQKPGTQGVQRPGTQRVQQPGTQRVARPGTQGVARPGTRRTPAAQQQKPARGRKQTAKAKAKKSRGGSRGLKELDKARLDMHRRKIPPVVILVGVIALVVVGVVGYIFLVPDEQAEIEKFSKKYMLAQKKSREYEEKGDQGDIESYERAIRVWDEFLGLYNDLPKYMKEKMEYTKGEAKGNKKVLEKRIRKAEGEAEQVEDFVNDAQFHLNNFDLDVVPAFLNDHDWIPKSKYGPNEKAADLYTQLEAKVEEVRGEKNRLKWPWVKTNRFDPAIENNDYAEAKKIVEEFIRNPKVESDDRRRAERAKDTILPRARSYLRKFYREARDVKKEKGRDAARKFWDEGVKQHFKGVIPEDELEKTWVERVRDWE